MKNAQQPEPAAPALGAPLPFQIMDARAIRGGGEGLFIAEGLYRTADTDEWQAFPRNRALRYLHEMDSWVWWSIGPEGEPGFVALDES